MEPQTALLTEPKPEAADSLHEREPARTVEAGPASQQLQPALPRTDSPLLQSAIGNRATQRLLTSTMRQPKLTIGDPDDVYEKQADAVADQVASTHTGIAASGASEGAGSDDDGELKRPLSGNAENQSVARQVLLRRMPIRTLQRTLGNRALERLLQKTLPAPATAELQPKCTCGGKSEGECAECRANRLGVQRDPVDEVPGAHAGPGEDSIEQRIESARGGGHELPERTRSQMEDAFGADFSGVRIHSGTDAQALSRDVGARAFATGPDVFFNANEYNPESTSGRWLLAHELTHTVQQGASPPLRRSRSGVLNAGPQAASRQVQAVPKVTAVNAPAEIGVGKTVNVSATVAGGGAVDWNLTPAPAGVAITPQGATRAKIVAAAGAAAAGGTTFKAEAKLKGTPADSAQSNNILIVAVTNVTFAANPPFANQPLVGGGVAAFPPNTADPNRSGYGGNTAVAAVTTAPAGRPTKVAVAGGGTAAPGATADANTVTPGANTGFMNVKGIDNATQTFMVKQLTVNPVPLRVSNLANVGVPGAGVYGFKSKITFQPSDAAGNPLNRPVGETITVEQDDFGLGSNINAPTGPNPGPVGALTAPANGWTDQLFTSANPGAGAGTPSSAVVAGQDPLDANNYIGPGVAAKLPRRWIIRQGFHHQSWMGAQSDEFDHGVHRRSLIQVGAAPKFKTEHVFPGGNAAQVDAYAGPALINLSAVAVVPNGATALAADGNANAQVTVVTNVPGRNVNWLVVKGPIAFTAPALGAAAPVAAPATVLAGMVPGKYQIQVQDSVFPNRQAKGFVTVVPVTLKNIAAAPSPVPAGTLSTVVSVNANPGGRTLAPTVDPTAAAAGVTAVNVAPGGGAAAAARQVTVTRPAGFTGFVTVTLRDNLRRGVAQSIRVKFL